MKPDETPETLRLTVPRTVLDMAEILAEAGETAYLVGGSVRDLLAGEKPSDWDIATTAQPKKVMEIFKRVIPTGIDHGTVTVLMGDDHVEVTTLRGEGAYADGRRPDSVVFLDDIEADLARRDFTVNAIAWEPISRAIHDPFGGRADLRAGVLRAVGDPAERFSEDGLRVMRAARFAATLGMDIDRATADAIPSAAKGLSRVSAERKRDELLKMLMSPIPSRGLSVMREGDLFRHALPRLAPVSRDDAAWERLRVRVDRTRAVVALRLAALLADLDDAGPTIDGLKLDRKTARLVKSLAAATPLDLTSPWTPPRARELMSRLGPETALDAAELTRAHLEAGSEDPAEAKALGDLIQSTIDAGVPLGIGDLAIGGKDLMSDLGLSPGPRIGDMLKGLLARVLQSPGENSRERLLEIAADLIGDDS